MDSAVLRMQEAGFLRVQAERHKGMDVVYPCLDDRFEVLHGVGRMVLPVDLVQLEMVPLV